MSFSFNIRAQYTGGDGIGDARSTSSGAPLPIELTDFSATYNSCTIELRWITASETNNDFFTIERSVDGITWNIINTVKGAGNTTSSLSYMFVDDAPKIGLQYYRLKQTDFDGKYSYSKIISFYFSCDNAPFINAFPNPTTGEFVLQLSPESTTNTCVKVYDMKGKTVQNNKCLTGTTNVLDISDQSNGIYIIEVNQDGQLTQIKLIKN